METAKLVIKSMNEIESVGGKTKQAQRHTNTANAFLACIDGVGRSKWIQLQWKHQYYQCHLGTAKSNSNTSLRFGR